MLRSRGAINPKDLAEALRKERPRPTPLPPPPPPRRQIQVKIDIGGVATAARWAWGAWQEYQHNLAREEQMILQLAQEHFGWLTLATIVSELGLSMKTAHSCCARLIEAELAQACIAKDGQTVYVFPAFLPHFGLCDYCQSEQLLGHDAKCSGCGAPLPSA